MTAVSAPAPAAVTDTFPINGTDYIEFYVGNAKQAAHYYRARLRLPADRRIAGPETGVRDRASYLLRAGQDPLRADDAARPRWRDRRARAASTATACGTSRSGWTTRARRSRWRWSGARRRRSEPDGAQGRARRGRDRRRSAPTATRSIRSSSGENYRGPVHARVSSRSTSPYRARQPVGLKYVDHCVGNVELGKMNEWVEFYARRDGLQQPAHVRRQGHLHRVLGADVEGDVERQRADQVPDQRAGGGEEEVADRGVPRVLRRPRRAAHRDRHERHHRDGDAAARSRRRVPPGARRRYYDTLLDRVGKIDEDLDPLRGARHPGRPRRRGLPAADLHEAGAGPPDAVLRDHPAEGREELREGQLQGAVRGDRARAGEACSRQSEQSL